MSWAISVKRVGADVRSKTISAAGDAAKLDGEASALSSKPEPTNFTVHVNPGDRMSTLHSQIEGITGLKASQQRLIYRGRIISGGSGKPLAAEASAEREDICVCDVDGLCDGQTIHLVPRKTETAATSTTSTVDISSNPALPDDSPSTSGHSGAGFLAALLGLGSSGLLTTEDDDISEDQESDFGNLVSLPRARSAGLSARRRSANPHRRIVSDQRYPEPRLLEPVRQNLMTVYTMLGSALQRPKFASYTQERRSNTLAFPRKWYRGQWIDCRDTVNQWLESTIVDIVLPEDILQIPTNAAFSTNKSSSRSRAPAVDPVIAASDIDGRRRLLLEPSSDENDGELADLNGDLDLTGYRVRNSNEGVQLLLVHYNGWPHRWDEWIRSDSERIRPFRTRTKHQPTRPHFASPESQSVFDAAPATHIKDKDDVIERSALLPELYRAMTAATNLLGESIPPNETLTELKNILGFQTNSLLPWISCPDGEITCQLKDDDERVMDDTANTSVLRKRSEERQHLEALAPILDRLGRTLVDVAPHIAALADSFPEGPVEESNTTIDDVMEIADDNGPSNVLTSLSLRPAWSASHEDSASASLMPSEQGNGSNHSQDLEVFSEPDHVDFVNSFVNISPEESSPSSRNLSRHNSRDDDTGSSLGSSLLSAYLSAAGLGNQSGDNEGTGNSSSPRVVLLTGGGGGGGSGIDIHIHAIVTGPGTGFGGLTGLTAINATPTNLETSVIDSGLDTGHNVSPDTASIMGTTARTQEDEDELGLFSDLYSENPTGLNSNNEPPDVHSLNREAVPADVNGEVGSVPLLLDENVIANDDTSALGAVPVNLEATVHAVIDETNLFTSNQPNNFTSSEFNSAALSDSSVTSSATSSFTNIASSQILSREAEASQNFSLAEQRRLSSPLSRLFRRTLNRRQS